MELKLGFSEWKVKRLGEIADVDPENLSSETNPDYSFKYISLENVDRGTLQGYSEQVFRTAPSRARRKVRKGDVLISTVRPNLKSHLIIRDEVFDVICSTGFSVVRCKSGIADPLFVYFHLFSSHVEQQIEAMLTGSNYPSINSGDVKELQIPCPPLPEQQAIATALSDVDDLIAKLEALITKKRNIKEAAMQQLLTGKQRLPGFSGKWEVKRLGDFVDLYRENVVPASLPKQTFVHFSLPAYDAGKTPTIELGSEIRSNKFRVPQDAVLVSKLNPRIPRIWAPPHIPAYSIASTEFLVLVPKETVSRSFLYVVCSSSSFGEKMELLVTGTTGSHQRINPHDALNITVSVPKDVGEQSAIATVLLDMDAEIAALEARLEKTRALKQGMMQVLLTGRIRLV